MHIKIYNEIINSYLNSNVISSVILCQRFYSSNRWAFQCWMPITLVCYMHHRSGSRKESQICNYSDVKMVAIASLITSLTIVYSIVYSDADQRKHQSSVSLAFVWGIHRWSVNSPHKFPVTRKMVPFGDVIMWDPVQMSTTYYWGVPQEVCCWLLLKFVLSKTYWCLKIFEQKCLLVPAMDRLLESQETADIDKG